MKKIVFLLSLITNIALSQNFYFKNRRESNIYLDSYGNKKYKEVKNETINYRFYFEFSADGKNTQLFTVYRNGVEVYWAAELNNYGLKEIGNKIFKSTLYYNMKTDNSMNVFFSENYSQIFIVTKETLTEYY